MSGKSKRHHSHGPSAGRHRDGGENGSGKRTTAYRGLDDLDRRILGMLQNDARMTSSEMARRVQLTPPGLQKRLRRLEESGVITRYVTVVNREAVGLGLMCFVQVTLVHHQPGVVQRFREALQSLAEVLECHHLTGEFDYLLKVVVESNQHLDRFLFEKLTQIPGVDKVRTSIVLSEIKASTSLPLG